MVVCCVRAMFRMYVLQERMLWMPACLGGSVLVDMFGEEVQREREEGYPVVLACLKGFHSPLLLSNSLPLLHRSFYATISGLQ